MHIIIGVIALNDLNRKEEAIEKYKKSNWD